MSDIEECISAYRDALAKLQKDIAITHHKTFAKYKGAFEGREAVLIGGGPTAKIFQPIKNAIYVGLNDAPLKFDLTFDFVLSIDYVGAIDMLEEIGSVKHKLYGINIAFPPNIFPERCYAHADKFYNYNFERKREDMQYTIDIDKECINTPASSVFNAVLFLLYTKIKTIYLVGFDCKAGTESIKNQAKGKNSKFQYEASIEGWLGVKLFMQKNAFPTRIVSVHPRGLKGIFDDLYQNKDALEAINYSDNGEYDHAMIHAERALQINPNHEGCLNVYAGIARKANPQQFLSFAYARLRKQPDWYQGYIELAAHFKDAGDTEMALYWLHKGDRRSGTVLNVSNVHLKIQLALQLYRAHKHEELEQYLKTQPTCFSRYFGFMLYHTTWFMPNDTQTMSAIADSLRYCQAPNVEEDLQFRLRRMGRYAEAEKRLHEIIERGYETTYVPWRHLLFLEQFRGNLEKAYVYAKKMFLNAPLWVNSWRHLLDILLSIKKIDEAYTLVKVLTDNIFHFDLSYYYSQIYNAYGDMDKAMYYATNVVEKFNIYRQTEFLPYVFHYCDLQRKTGNYEKSKKILLSYLEKMPNFPSIIRALSTHYSESGDTLSAFFYAKRLYEISTENGTYAPQYISILKKMGKIDEAISILEKQVAKDPQFSLGYFELSVCYDIKKDFDKSVYFIDKAILFDPHCLKYMIKSLDIRKKVSIISAVYYCHKYISNNQDVGYLYTYLSSLYNQQEKDIQLDYAFYGYELNPENILCISGLVNSFLKNNMYANAIAFTQCYLEKHQNNPVVYTELAKIYEPINPITADTYFSLACEHAIHNTSILDQYINFLDRYKDKDKEKEVIHTYIKYNQQWRKGWNILLQLEENNKVRLRLMQQCCEVNPSWADINYKFAYELEQGQQESII